MDIIKRKFYNRQTHIVAQELIGKILYRKINNIVYFGEIIETESYGFLDDKASHAYCGPTKRNSPMFGPVGHAYVYKSYGIHHCLNLIAYDPTQKAGGVLIRALLPLEGKNNMLFNRKQNDLRIVTNGPGKLTQALKISLEENNLDITQNGPLFIVDQQQEPKIKATPRIGISQEQERLWRFVKD